MRVRHIFKSLLVLAVVASVPNIGHAFTSESISRAIRSFMPDAPVMVEIARCESGLRQYDLHGAALRGGLGGHMIGLFQLHETYHRDAARTLGYNIDSLLGNIAYARELFRKEGTTPWNSSAHCWDSPTTTHSGKDTAVRMHITKVLRYGMSDAEVHTVQDKLDAAGYATSKAEKDRSYFGIQTFMALMRFQCDHGIACWSDPSQRARVGVVDRATRAALETSA